MRRKKNEDRKERRRVEMDSWVREGWGFKTIKQEEGEGGREERCWEGEERKGDERDWGEVWDGSMGEFGVDSIIRIRGE